jgi:hypothetical protein
MKKLIAITITLALTLGLALVAIPAAAEEVTTEVTVTGGVTLPPIIKAKWEQDDSVYVAPHPLAGQASLEDGDPDHLTPGSQFLPPGVFGETKEIQYWVVVTDPEGVSTVDTVSIEVYHPEGQPECGSKKYQVICQKVDKFTIGLPAYQAARAAGLVTWNNDPVTMLPYGPCTFVDPVTMQVVYCDRLYDADGDGVGDNCDGIGDLVCTDDIWFELDKCTAEVYMGTKLIDYHQPAGIYRVDALASDVGNAWSYEQPGHSLTNYFEYIGVPGFEIDFDDFNYGTATKCEEKWIAGDTIFDDPVDTAPNPNPATVRNIGNLDIKLTIMQNDMGFDHSGPPVTEYSGSDPPAAGESTWNVVFDARLGSIEANGVYYDPFVEVTLPNPLRLCNTEELDFSIHVVKGNAGTRTGTMTIGLVVEPFDLTPCSPGWPPIP